MSIVRRCCLAILVVVTACAPALSTQAPATAGPQATAAAPASVLPNADGSVKFLVIGDSGTGGGAQYALAEHMVHAYARFKFEFAIMLGDNLYGSENPSDYLDKFEKPYRRLLDAGVTFHASLGNHDEPAQRFYKPFNMDGKRYYTFEKGGVAFFVMDTTYMPPAQVEWLQKELETKKNDWKIAYGHHPIYSSGERHGSEMDLRAIIEPLFLKHGVDVVFAGHEHFYERIKPQHGIYYFVQGGAAKLRRGNISKNSPLTASGFDSDNSFTLVEIEGDRMFFETISRKGLVVDAGVIPRRETAATSTQ